MAGVTVASLLDEILFTRSSPIPGFKMGFNGFIVHSAGFQCI